MRKAKKKKGVASNIAELWSLSISPYSSSFHKGQRNSLETPTVCDTKNTRPHWQRAHQAVVVGAAILAA